MQLAKAKSTTNMQGPMQRGAEPRPRDATAASDRNNSYYTSYSANCEDVILHRIFGRKRTGFFVDVGAAHPTFENDTKLLYDAGWSGVNIEPNPDFFKALESERVRDRNYCLALSNEVGDLTYYEVVGTGLSTCEQKLADRAREKGYEVVTRLVPTTTLARILENTELESFDLLKVDVEGFEEQVLSGNDWKKFRPSVIVVEATYPESPKRRPTNIRAQLESEDYVWRYFDGLNDFYVDKNFELSDDVFDRPPNVFDRFKLRALVELEREVAKSREYAGTLEKEVAKSREYTGSLEKEVAKSLEYASSLKQEVAKANRHATSVEARLADETFERRRLAHATDRMRQEITAYSQELEIAHRNREELLHVKGLLAQLERRAESSAAAYKSIVESRSWALTRPYRVIGRIFKRLF